MQTDFPVGMPAHPDEFHRRYPNPMDGEMLYINYMISQTKWWQSARSLLHSTSRWSQCSRDRKESVSRLTSFEFFCQILQNPIENRFICTSRIHWKTNWPPLIIWNFPDYRQNHVKFSGKIVESSRNSIMLINVCQNLKNSPQFYKTVIHSTNCLSLEFCKSAHQILVRFWKNAVKSVVAWKIGFDTAESEPRQVCCMIRARESRFGPALGIAI